MPWSPGKPLYDDSVPGGVSMAATSPCLGLDRDPLLHATGTACAAFGSTLAASCALLDEVCLGRRMDFDTEVMVRLHWRWGAHALRADPGHLSRRRQLTFGSGGTTWTSPGCTRWCAACSGMGCKAACRAGPALAAGQATLVAHAENGGSAQGQKAGWPGVNDIGHVPGQGARCWACGSCWPAIGCWAGRASRRCSTRHRLFLADRSPPAGGVRAVSERLEAFAASQQVALPPGRERASGTSCAGEAALDKLAGWRGDIPGRSSWWGESTTRQPLASGRGLLLLGSPSRGSGAVPGARHPGRPGAHQCPGVHPPRGPLQRPAQAGQSGCRHQSHPGAGRWGLTPPSCSREKIEAGSGW